MCYLGKIWNNGCVNGRHDDELLRVACCDRPALREAGGMHFKETYHLHHLPLATGVKADRICSEAGVAGVLAFNAGTTVRSNLIRKLHGCIS